MQRKSRVNRKVDFANCKKAVARGYPAVSVCLKEKFL